MISNWNSDQWNAFAGFAVMGLAALALVAVGVYNVRRRRHAAREVAELIAQLHADRAHRARPVPDPDDRPLATLATLAALTSPTVPLLAGPVAEPLAPPLPLPVVDPTGQVLEHLAPGPGSLTSLAAAGEGSLDGPVELIDAEVSAQFADVFERWQRSVDAALAPAMLVAVRWAIEGRMAGVAGRGSLDGWRAGTETGEWQLVEPRQLQGATS